MSEITLAYRHMYLNILLYLRKLKHYYKIMVKVPAKPLLLIFRNVWPEGNCESNLKMSINFLKS